MTVHQLFDAGERALLDMTPKDLEKPEVSDFLRKHQKWDTAMGMGSRGPPPAFPAAFQGQWD